MRFKKYAVIFFVLCFIAGFNFLLLGKKEARNSFHTEAEKKFITDHFLSVIDSGEFFLHSYTCKGCHGSDTLQIANVDANGVDINLYDDWSATMMANSAIDPLWRAKVSHEILVDPGHATGLQDKCTSCHAPMGHYTAFYKGFPHYGIADLENDSLGLNGVACAGCHMIGTNNLGNIFSGNIPYDSTKKEFGPFINPVAGPMQLYVGIIPTYSAHVSESRFCSPCHTLEINTTDLNGTLTGGTFFEQTTFQEWINSTFPADNVNCQKCHMPQTTDSIIIANGILNLPPRAPFNKHKFSGGNSFMVQLIKDNKLTLGIETPDKNFDSTLAANNRLLQQNTLMLHTTLENLTADSAFVKVRITNLAGHKFPSGYPSRRAVLQFVAIDQNNDTIFKSGMFDSTFEVINIDPTFEHHYNVISDEQQMQIYEMVMGDVNNDKTTVLERADTMLKDNRIPPEGFLSTSTVYDTVKIAGDALTDPDFNKDTLGNEGTGRDYVHYHFPVAGLTGTIKVYAKVFFQAVPPGWLSEMFSYQSAAIDSFKNMYMAANRAPVLIATDSLSILSIGISKVLSENGIFIFPNPARDGKINIITPAHQFIQKVEVFDIEGKQVQTVKESSKQSVTRLNLPAGSRGIYFLKIYTGGKKIVKKVVTE